MGSTLKISKASGRREKLQRFPIILETYRTCLRDIFDIETLKTIPTKLRDRSMSVQEVETDMASPLARSLVFDYVAAWIYEGDAPLAERRAQALTLDRNLLRDLWAMQSFESYSTLRQLTRFLRNFKR